MCISLLMCDGEHLSIYLLNTITFLNLCHFIIGLWDQYWPLRSAFKSWGYSSTVEHLLSCARFLIDPNHCKQKKKNQHLKCPRQGLGNAVVGKVLVCRHEDLISSIRVTKSGKTTSADEAEGGRFLQCCWLARATIWWMPSSVREPASKR